MKLTKTIKDQIIAGIMNDVPSEPYLDQLQEWLDREAFKQLPESLKELIVREPDIKNYLGYVNLYEHRTFSVFNLQFTKTEAVKEHLHVILGKWDAQTAERRRLRRELEGLFSVVTTDKQFKECYPEFVKYMPPEVAKTPDLPATQVLTELMKAGWPKK